ncbi:fructose-6-phosphate aldolase [Marinilactibacillus sp. 15R]|uniref:Probable transaldolase n=1 Tax=Marinilactibacillus piezotolerans TaxID=258723 RepID=A0A1I4AIN9_9LACT|nr:MULTISPECIES: fructose-6-phosphate aldolase [Marinilactibacillus]API89814.1 fructose-6-phosphate aldolase [Marinilactibacillus sp. 15R]SFK55811.1 transaldolase [Marinilactibacillus piezotolerans]
MKFFIDTANVEEIRYANSLGLLDGVTTNPTLIAKEGRPFEEVIKEICSIVNGPVSAEVISLKADDMIDEARELATWSKNVVVKIPMTIEGLKAVHILSQEGIKTNVTLIFSVAQGLMAAKAGATYVSPFMGRLEDISSDGLGVISDLKDIFDEFGFETEIISASIRTTAHVENVAKVGAHIATIPGSQFSKMAAHPLTDKGIEGFLKDWENYQKKIS